ncbi:MAG: aminotransferase class V-fold PLP-dependent enzyme, partial [Clostridiaceae bacterium]|nr:aminotransferase class V-fold PLP-dependent enzyme [Clostridiaceae bacterium]
AHKMYAPFGTGVLIGPKSTFEKGEPEYSGGGTILAVSSDDIYWANPPDKDEAGTPNVIGALALAESIKVLNEVGMNSVRKHEKELTKYMLEKIYPIKGFKSYLSTNKKVLNDMVGVIPFNIEGFHHSFLSTVLSAEGAIGVRNGCFCAHPYIHSLLRLSATDISNLQRDILFGRMDKVPGLVRISFGIYNTKKEINEFVRVLKYIVDNKNSLEQKYKYTKNIYTLR